MAEEKKKPLSLRRMVEEVIEFNNGLIIENVDIGGKEYKLKVINHGGRLVLDFNDRDYEITIDERGIKFERLAYRPNHDHNDSESLQIGDNESVMGVKKDEIKWRARFPYAKEGYEFFYVPFGARTVNW